LQLGGDNLVLLHVRQFVLETSQVAQFESQAAQATTPLSKKPSEQGQKGKTFYLLTLVGHSVQLVVIKEHFAHV
jgi:hypothetical protein